jgi:hypothetical protein
MPPQKTRVHSGHISFDVLYSRDIKIGTRRPRLNPDAMFSSSVSLISFSVRLLILGLWWARLRWKKARGTKLVVRDASDSQITKVGLTLLAELGSLCGAQDPDRTDRTRRIPLHSIYSRKNFSCQPRLLHRSRTSSLPNA